MVKKTVEKFLHCSKVKTPRSLSQGQKGLITRNIHVKYESTSTHSSNVISKVKVFKKWVKLPRSRSQGKKNGTHGKSYHNEYSCEIPRL